MLNDFLEYCKTTWDELLTWLGDLSQGQQAALVAAVIFCGFIVLQFLFRKIGAFRRARSPKKFQPEDGMAMSARSMSPPPSEPDGHVYELRRAVQSLAETVGGLAEHVRLLSIANNTVVESALSRVQAISTVLAKQSMEAMAEAHTNMREYAHVEHAKAVESLLRITEGAMTHLQAVVTSFTDNEEDTADIDALCQQHNNSLAKLQQQHAQSCTLLQETIQTVLRQTNHEE